MEESDQLKQELGELETLVNQEKEKTDAETEQLRQELHALETERVEQLKQRKEFLPQIDKVRRDEYHRWMKAQLAKPIGCGTSESRFCSLR